MLQPAIASYDLHEALTSKLSAERPRLVALCRSLTRDAAAAEDMAQETLLTAWRLRERLIAPEGLSAWLAAIARNHCRRWARAKVQARARLLSLDPDTDAALEEQFSAATTLGSDDPVEAIEREEMAGLARRALALAPAASRDLLAAAYLDERATDDSIASPEVSKGAHRARLTRARQAARAALSADSELRIQLEELGLILPADDHWVNTRIWCPFCGASYLLYRIDREHGDYAIRCASGCDGRRGGVLAVAGCAHSPELTRAVYSVKALIARHCLKLEHDYRLALQRGWANCDCGYRSSFTAITPTDAPPGWPTPYGIYGACPHCGLVEDSTAWHLTLDTAEAQRFWRRYPRMRALPLRGVEHEGHEAIVTGFEEVGGAARLEIVSDARDYTVLLTALSHAV
jgi:RNA polymerase sigma-70 factor (ECF subfamily)